MPVGDCRLRNSSSTLSAQPRPSSPVDVHCPSLPASKFGVNKTQTIDVVVQHDRTLSFPDYSHCDVNVGPPNEGHAGC